MTIATNVNVKNATGSFASSAIVSSKNVIIAINAIAVHAMVKEKKLKLTLAADAM